MSLQQIKSLRAFSVVATRSATTRVMRSEYLVATWTAFGYALNLTQYIIYSSSVKKTVINFLISYIG